MGKSLDAGQGKRARQGSKLAKSSHCFTRFIQTGLTGREPRQIIKRILILIYCKLFPGFLMSINGFNATFIVFKWDFFPLHIHI